MVLNSMALSKKEIHRQAHWPQVRSDWVFVGRLGAWTATISSALECGFAFFQERFYRFAMVLCSTGHRLAPCFAIEQFAELVGDREVEVCLHVAVGEGWTVGDALGGSMDIVAER